jgi:hypothetical protein
MSCAKRIESAPLAVPFNAGAVVITAATAATASIVVLISFEFCKLRCNVWVAWCRHRPDDVDVDFRNCDLIGRRT